MYSYVALLVLVISSSTQLETCSPAATRCSGTEAPPAHQINSGQLIFEDNFDEFDLKRWEHENTLSGGGVS